MKKTHWFRMIFILSLLGNVVLAFYIHYKNEADRQILEQVAFRSIQTNLVQLEGAIAYQNDHGWEQPSHVTEKLDDVREGVGLALEIGSYTPALDQEKEHLLWRLYNHLTSFKTDSGFPNATLSDRERDELIALGDHLRSAGWGMNMGYGSGWEEFEAKVRKLITPVH